MAKVKKKLKIDGMHCTSCALNIDMDLEDLEGVESAQTSYAKHITEVEFDEDRVQIKDITGAIVNLGYQVVVLN